MSERPVIIPQIIIPPVRQPGVPEKKKIEGGAFGRMLEQELSHSAGLKFSRHAQERLDKREIALNEQQVLRLNEAVEKAESKGCRESLVLLDNMAFVVSIKNKTVITALNGESRKENVFTNIDSAVIN